MMQVNDHPEWEEYDDYTRPEPARIIDDPALPVILHGQLVPINNEGYYVPNFHDTDGVVHFFAPAGVSVQPDLGDLSYELRYYRVAETEDGRIVHDSHSVMPLERPGDYSFPRSTLEWMLMHDELDSAVDLAHVTAQSHGFAFPEPDAMPPLRTGVEYDFRGAVEDDGSPALQAVKGWREGSADHEQRVTIASYGSAAELDVDSRDLDTLMQTEGVEAAMNLAEGIAVASGYLHDGREDTRLFTEGPPDVFTTNAERDRAAETFIREYGERDTEELPAASIPPTDLIVRWSEEDHASHNANAQFEGAAWFEATFGNNPEITLLQPLDDTVNYAVVVTDADPWTTELAVEKYWREPGGFVGSDSLTVETYDPDEPADRELAQADRADLLSVYAEQGLEAMMHQAELDAMENGHLSRDRADTGLFRDGLPDRFASIPNATERVYLLDEADMAQPAPGSWDELVAMPIDDLPPTEAHYWQTHFRPVETPNGEPLGTALFVTEFPGLPPDFDKQLDELGMSDADYPTQARTLEIAHFATEADAAKFDAEFRGYLVPGLLDGPELAPEVAKLEGLSGEWRDMDYDEIVDCMSGQRTVVREESAWRLHNPNAEREMREAFEQPQNDLEL